MHRVLPRGLGLLLLLVALLSLGAPAQAHDYLVSSSPGTGDTTSPAPTEVSLLFNTSIGQDFAQVAVVGPDGGTYQDGTPVVDGATVTQAVGALPDGNVTISYRVVSSDGHPIGGTIPFTVESVLDQATAGETSSDVDEQPGEASATESSSAEETSSASSDDATQSAAATEATSGPDPLVWVVGLGAVAVIGAVGIGLARRRSRTTTDA
jgi:methionine-rich copper-binding protein CopC